MFVKIAFVAVFATITAATSDVAPNTAQTEVKATALAEAKAANRRSRRRYPNRSRRAARRYRRYRRGKAAARRARYRRHPRYTHRTRRYHRLAQTQTMTLLLKTAGAVAAARKRAKSIGDIAKRTLGKMTKKEQRFVKGAFNIIRKCKPLWGSAPAKCINSGKCATILITKCFNNKKCRDGAAVKIGHCVSARGKLIVNKRCSKFKTGRKNKCRARVEKRLKNILRRSAKPIARFVAIVLRKNIPATCRKTKACRRKAIRSIKTTVFRKMKGSIKRAIFAVKKSLKRKAKK